jgi:pyruvate dehydrogenase E2 component (dihydrolipoamide acetyltransferase)
MPDPGTDEAEARIVAWRVSVGDEVEEGGPICLVSVDGHHAEVLSAYAGRVAELLVGVDARVSAGASLAELAPIELEMEASDPGAEPELEEEAPTTNGHEPAWAPEVQAWINDLRVTVELEPEPGPEPPREPLPAPEPVDPASFHSPAVRRLAAEYGIDLSEVTGTGERGRIRKEDVLALTAPP